jgi:hypothetical protein
VYRCECCRVAREPHDGAAIVEEQFRSCKELQMRSLVSAVVISRFAEHCLSHTQKIDQKMDTFSV